MQQKIVLDGSVPVPPAVEAPTSPPDWWRLKLEAAQIRHGIGLAPCLESPAEAKTRK